MPELRVEATPCRTCVTASFAPAYRTARPEDRVDIVPRQRRG